MWEIFSTQPERPVLSVPEEKEFKERHRIAVGHMYKGTGTLFKAAGGGKVVVLWGMGEPQQMIKMRALVNNSKIDANPDDWKVPHQLSTGGLKPVLVYGKITGFQTLGTQTVYFLETDEMPYLRYLWLLGERVFQLDVTKNPELRKLICSCNGISKLDLSNNQRLRFLSCQCNNLSRDALLSIFNDLPQISRKETAYISFHTNPGYKSLTAGELSILKAKNWHIIEE